MAVWAIGDVQGCDEELKELLDAIGFDPKRDRLWFCGDLVNRGGRSLEVLRRVRALGDRATVVLGNHDLSLLAVACAGRRGRIREEFARILAADDADELITWLRTRKLAHHDAKLGWLMVHAGLDPRWSVEKTLALAGEVEAALAGPRHSELLRRMFGDKPASFQDSLKGISRLRAIINVLTRLRYCDERGRIDFKSKGPPGTQKSGFHPWFSVPGMKQRRVKIVCGHWSTLGLFIACGVYGIDTGCVWGGRLTALRLDDPAPLPAIISVPARPGRCAGGD